ncbi:MAG: hypothetical protein ACFB03_03165 [Paracoccaceae bacterium]
MKLDELKNETRRITLIVCAGFEDRAIKATERLIQHEIRLQNLVVVKFRAEENRDNEKALLELSKQLVSQSNYIECEADELSPLTKVISSLRSNEDLVVFDITGCSRSVMLVLLSQLYDIDIEFDILYTEAEEYYPTFGTYEEITEDDDQQHAFLRLNMFEESEVLHSSHCEIESFSEFEGRMLPSYPFYLITFLPFKRGRLSAILQSLESQVRIFIRGQPVRDDLKWRGEAVDIPNADLVDEGTVVDLETLDWRKTFSFLESQYRSNGNMFRYNFIVAPLGSKMQTVGCALFAKAYSEVRIITSTPKQHYADSYSRGSRETFIFRGISAAKIEAEVNFQ